VYVNAQQEGFKKINRRDDNDKRWTAGMAMGITPLPDNQASLLPGIEFFISERFSVYNEIALHLNKNHHADSSVMNKKYFRYKAEGRFYFTSSTIWSRPFIGLQFTTATRKFNIEKGGNYFERKQTDSTWLFDRASVNSPFLTGSLQLGLSKRIAEELFIETSIGYGLKFINTEYNETINLRKDRFGGWFAIKPASSYRYIGHTTQSHFTLFIRLFYRF
jgi:hypothetical protein